MSDIEGKVAREAMSECGQRASFNAFGVASAKAGKIVGFGLTLDRKTDAIRVNSCRQKPGRGLAPIFIRGLH